VARILEVRRLGRTPYEETHALQEQLVEERLAGAIGDVLILTEHEPVITLGRKSGDDPAAVTGSVAGVPVVSVERGGEATYHGPGQLVAYPIYLLPEGRRDLHRYLRDLEEVVIRMLAEVEVEGRRRPGLTGVWVGDKKLASIGVAVRRWVAWHGFSLNLFTDLEVYRSFRPCGLDPEVIRRFRRGILALRDREGLYDELHDRMPSVYGQVLPGYGTPVAKAPGAVQFIIGPEAQFKSFEDYLRSTEDPNARVTRLYPRDFWQVRSF